MTNIQCISSQDFTCYFLITSQFFWFKECIIHFVSASVIGMTFMLLGTLPVNQSFQNKRVFSFPTWCTFSLQVIVRQKLMTALATFLDPLIFSPFISMESTCSVECTLPVSLVITLHVVFTLLLDSAIGLL